ncbi:MmgE/PrpD family protein [Paragemmobacter ruber]|uniref:MmgE/PrpD family protein n=1 Tax=Paragemmobacter ruber TaxID=1985673 RepID=A0ABW9Y3S2_9RHOB|nr:MmgE/PrpD family protein [Rhodobacter ruber]NBE07185.1 MmgE/PrpD family protein [Rhodobacter ruber]
MTDLTVSERLADWLADFDLSTVPAAARRAAADTILDTVCLTVAALETDYGRSVRAAFPDPGPATVWGLPEGRAPEAAAVINGTCGHGEDYDNTFEGCPVHSGVVIIPALLAAAERYGLSATDTARGIVAGIEVMCRLGLVADKAVHKAGFHPTAVLGAMSAAAGVATALRLDRTAIRNALGVAGSTASGIIEYLADGSSTKRLHAGWAAQAGMRAAALGAAGFTGPTTVFEGDHGFFYAFSTPRATDFAPLVDDLGTRWEAARLAFKPFACGTMTQPYVDAAIALARRGIRPEDVVRITCDVGEGTVHRLWEPLALKQQPPTPYAAKFSGPYCLAAGWVWGDAGLAQFTETSVRDPRVLSLAAKVNFRIDPANEYPANYTGHIKAELADGTIAESFIPCLRGGARAPMTREDLLVKARANLAFAGRDSAAADRLASWADALMEGTGTPTSGLLRC